MFLRIVIIENCTNSLNCNRDCRNLLITLKLVITLHKETEFILIIYHALFVYINVNPQYSVYIKCFHAVQIIFFRIQVSTSFVDFKRVMDSFFFLFRVGYIGVLYEFKFVMWDVRKESIAFKCCHNSC